MTEWPRRTSDLRLVAAADVYRDPGVGRGDSLDGLTHRRYVIRSRRSEHGGHGFSCPHRAYPLLGGKVTTHVDHGQPGPAQRGRGGHAPELMPTPTSQFHDHAGTGD